MYENLDDVLIGTDEADEIYGIMGDDDIRGMGGDDWLVGGEGDDLIDGGAGMDIAMYYDGRAVTVDLAGGTAERGEELDSLTNIEGIWGSRFNDIVKGDGGANYAFGGAGHDTLMGMGGDDELRGGMGHDDIQGGAGDDFLVGNQGNDTLMGGDDDDRMQGGNDDDVLIGGTGMDTLVGGPGADKIKGGTFVMSTPTTNADTGGDGLFTNDTGEDSDDTASYFSSAEGVTIDLTAADPDGDTVSGNGVPNGGPVLELDSMAGGDAVGDTLYGIENLQGSMMGDMLTGRVEGSSLWGLMGDDTLIGGTDQNGANGMDDMLMGGAGDDVLIGNQGVDTLTGGPGADKLKGGAFDPDAASPEFVNATNSTASYATSDAGVTIDLSKAKAAADVDNSDAPVLELDEDAGGHAMGDTLYGIENLTGSMMGDMLTGDASVNVLMGGDGDDTLMGGAEADRLYGGDGDDMIDGGDGSDIIDAGKGDDMIVGDTADVVTIATDNTGMTAGVVGGAGMDTLDYSEDESAASLSIDLADGNGIEVVMADTNRATTVDANGVTKFAVNLMGGDEGDTFTGGSMGDMLTGGKGGDALNGGAGDDRIMGGDGADSIDGGAGDDTIMTGDGGGTASGDNTTIDDSLHGADMITGGKEADTLNGNGGDDTIMGMAGNDIIDGGAGDDMITGGTGNDSLTGGTGADTFVYNMGDGNDTISGGFNTDNFGDVVDLIDISALGLSEAQVREMINDATFVGSEVMFDLSDANEDLEGTITIQQDNLSAADVLSAFGF
jgi:Ca2+-binding RTX toxin-like protein